MNLKKIYLCLSGVVFSVALVACGNDAPQVSSKVSENQEPTMVQETHAPMTETAITGKVLETMDAAGYTYVKLDDGSGKEIWAAGPQTKLAVGDEIAVQGGNLMVDFTSKTLNRTFDEIIFASGFLSSASEQVASGGSSFAAAVQEEHGSMVVTPDSAASGGSTGAIVPFVDLKIEKAAGENSKTVGEVYAQAADLDTQKVAVKGQVVKISRNIMGKNWIHLQDGTGDPMNNTHDLVVTTNDQAEKGAIVTVEGITAANKDFGSGYRYDVIIEDAVVTQ